MAKLTLTKRHRWLGVKSFFKWIRNPVSDEGGKHVFRLRVYLKGPEYLADYAEMQANPYGQELLRHKPQLIEYFCDRYLIDAPEGSFGKQYYAMLQAPEVIPSYLVGGLVYRDGFMDSLDINEDIEYMLERSVFDHDARHMITGYGTDVAGELLLATFNYGYSTRASLVQAFISPVMLYMLLMRPKIGYRQWFKHMAAAYRSGRRAREHLPYHSVPYEKLLKKPLSEVRQELGITPLPEDWSTEDWFAHSRFAKSIENGRGKKEELHVHMKGAQTVIEVGGINWKSFCRAARNKQEIAIAAYQRGENREDILSVLA